MKKQLPLLLSAIFIVALLLLFDGEIAQNSLATDSGFDTSYDGGSSWGSDSGWSSDSSWDYGYSGSSNSYSSSGGDDIFLFFFFGILAVSVIIGLIMKIRWEMQIRKYESQYKERIEGIQLDVDSSMANAIYKPNIVTEEDKQKLQEAYQIYLDVQKAWMNFDYNELRRLVTDELYNTYQNQMKTLELKGQKNIMTDFNFLSSSILSKSNNEGTKTMKVQLTVSFYDYIVDEREKVIRGNKKKKVEMTYLLTFVYQEQASEKCPNCGAPLENKELKCSYCNTKIQAITKEMRLTKKECIRQR